MFQVFLLLLLLDLARSDLCSDRKVHLTSEGQEYHFSWLDHPDKVFSWTQGRKYCKNICMDLVSLETSSQWETVQEIFRKENLTYTWTSGRKCNFAGCDKPSLLPTIANGWFWASTKKRIPNPFSESCRHCEWGPTGALGKRQPDNRQGVTDNLDEGCLAILNNLYEDGIKWHDVACHHAKPVICRDP